MSEKKKKAPERRDESLKDRVLDRIPVFGTVRRTKGWMRRHKGLIYLLIAVAVIFVVRPVLTIIAGLFTVLQPFITAMFESQVGRLIFYNVFAIILLWIVWRQVRRSVFRVYGLRAMRHFLDGMNLMILGRWDKAIPCFEKVKSLPRWINLEDAVPEHRDIRVDTHLKIAACHLRRGRANEAKAWLLRVKENEILTKHVMRNHAELRALAYDTNDEMEAETVIKELEKTESKDRRNRRVLRALQGRYESAGDLEGARKVTAKLVAGTDGREREEAERDLALLEFRVAHKAMGEGDRKRVLKALKATSTDTRSALKLGELALEAGDVKGALKAWSRAVSLPVFDRIAALLESGQLAGDKEQQLLKSYFPYVGTMIVLAEHYRKRGDYRKARTALDMVLGEAGENLTVLRSYAACLEAEGNQAEAAALYRRALSQSFQA